jgi:DNA-binding response OmpR family regulator
MIIAGNGQAEDIEHFLRSGADNVFVKPFDMDLFEATMRA